MLKNFELKKNIRNCKMLDDIWNRVQSWIIILIYHAGHRDMLDITTLKAACFSLKFRNVAWSFFESNFDS